MRSPPPRIFLLATSSAVRLSHAPHFCPYPSHLVISYVPSHGTQGDLVFTSIRSLMSSNDLTAPGAPDEVGQDRRGIHTLAGDRFIPWRTQGTYQHPQIRSLIAKHCEQLSSGLVDLFRTEVEREVKERVSEVIASEATVFCEQLRSKDETILAAEARCEDLREQLETSKQMCCQLQERVRELESTEAELRTALNKGSLEVRSSHPQVTFPFTCSSCSSGYG